MAEYLQCGTCSNYAPLILGNGRGKCVKYGKDVCETSVHCCQYTRITIKQKVKPRRLCDFCERRMPILDDYGRYTMESVKTESCPTVNLTTGERTEPDENGEYVLLIFDENGHGRDPGMFPIKFCPYCGRKLGGEN